ncbi:MAG: hypothetical protein QOD77_2076 [Thermoplasmata archaeon]|jgi:MFS family permease|nr:hypothetical protein [Thermoplasmata archaeon]
MRGKGAFGVARVGARVAEPHGRIALPAWTWAYVTFRLGDGLSSALIPLAIVLHYDMPVWVLALTTAAQNLASVPATFLWGALMDRGIRRRPLVVAGFAVAAASMLVLATLPDYWLFVLAAVSYTAFGVATSPAASTMVLQKVPRARWGRTTGALSRRTGFAYLTGMAASILVAMPGDYWRAAGGWGAAVADLGFVGFPHFSANFAVAAVLSLGAALAAARLVPPWQPPLPHEAGFDTRLIQASARRFERPVFFLGRLRHGPTFAGIRGALTPQHRLWPIGYALTFMGSVCFFASYTGILAEHLLLPAGLVLLAQFPSNLVTPITYPHAGRWGARIGEARGVLAGAYLRTGALPLLCLTVAFWGAAGYPAILLLHGLMGLSFALIQVNGPVLLAEVHPGGRGQGVGTYHAAVGAGTLLGALSAFVLLRAADYRWSYLFAAAVAALGCLMLVLAARRSPQSLRGDPGLAPA